jgi:hypothetical protein
VDHYPDNVPDFQTDPRAKAYPFVYDSQEMPDLMASIARGTPARIVQKLDVPTAQKIDGLHAGEPKPTQAASSRR